MSMLLHLCFLTTACMEVVNKKKKVAVFEERLCAVHNVGGELGAGHKSVSKISM